MDAYNANGDVDALLTLIVKEWEEEEEEVKVEEEEVGEDIWLTIRNIAVYCSNNDPYCKPVFQVQTDLFYSYCQ